MDPETKLYQLLEKAKIDTKIAIEIQDWILDTMEDRRSKLMFNIEQSKLLPMNQDLKKEVREAEIRLRHEIQTIRTELLALIREFRAELKAEMQELRTEVKAEMHELRTEHKIFRNDLEALRLEMNLRFEMLNKRLDSTDRMIRILGVPIIGSTIGALGIILLKIFETVF